MFHSPGIIPVGKLNNIAKSIFKEHKGIADTKIRLSIDYSTTPWSLFR
jgi:hypothetical protein